MAGRPNFDALAKAQRKFKKSNTRLVGPVPTLALTPVADGRVGAYEDNVDRTWKMVQKVYNLIDAKVRTADGTPVRIVVAPEIVYGPRTGAIAQKYYAEQNVGANIWISRSWCYSDELLSAASGIGSSEWIQAAYGLNQTDRPGAVWLKAFTAAMDEKKRPIFCIYSPDLEDETQDLNDFVAERLVRFARCAATVMQMRGKNYLSVGSVSMGIIGSDVRRNLMQDYLGMGTVSYDMVGIRGRMDKGLYDHEELDKAVKFLKKFDMDFGDDPRPMSHEQLIEDTCKMMLIVRDLMVGNEKLASKSVAKSQGFVANTEYAQGANAIAAGTQGQRMWTDLYPNFDVAESILNSSFGWEGPRTPYIVATENDSKNAIGMLAAHLLTGGSPQLFADIRTNWTAESIKAATGTDVSKIAPDGIIDKRNSGAGALDFAVNALKYAKDKNAAAADAWESIRSSKTAHEKLMKAAVKGTTYMGADLVYFPGDGLSSHYRTPGGVPMTAYRYNTVGEMLTCSIVEGETVELPINVADHIRDVTTPTWPESYWAPRGMSSFEYMSRIGPNHDANSFGLIGADMITLNAMLRIPIDMHNIGACDIFRPTMWDRFGGDDYRACDYLGPLYA